MTTPFITNNKGEKDRWQLFPPINSNLFTCQLNLNYSDG